MEVSHLVQCQSALALLEARHLDLVLALVILSLSVVSVHPSVMMVVVVSQVVRHLDLVLALVIVNLNVVSGDPSVLMVVVVS